jgi:hypothetical protein
MPVYHLVCLQAAGPKIVQGALSVGPRRTVTCDNELFVHSPPHSRSHLRGSASGADAERPLSHELQSGGYGEMRAASAHNVRLWGS